MSKVMVKYVNENNDIDVVLGEMPIGGVISGEFVSSDLGINLEDIEEDADSAFIQFVPQWDKAEDKYTLNISVYQTRCERKDEIFTMTLTKDDIEYEIERNYGYKARFVGYSDIVPHFRYGRKSENVSIDWHGKNEVAISILENVTKNVDVYFNVINEDNEEEELLINIDTNFAY